MLRIHTSKHLFVLIIGLLFLFSLVALAGAENVVSFKEYGKVSDHRFYYPQEIDIGPDGVIYIADYSNHAVKAFKETGENVFSIANETGSGAGQFKNPTGVVRDKDGNIWVVDYNNHRLQRFDGNGSNPVVFGANGAVSSSRLNGPDGVVKGLMVTTGYRTMRMTEWWFFRLRENR